MTLSPRNLAVAGSLLLGLLGVMSPAVAADAPQVAKECFDCHGDNGVSKDSEIPTIAGPSAFFLENQLLMYQQQARPCVKDKFDAVKDKPDVKAADHCALAKSLSEKDISALTEYFSAQKFVPADQPVDAALAKTGGDIADHRCAKCHSEGGSLAMDDAGILAGQWKPYLLEQLKHFKAGSRWQPDKMKPQIEKLSEQDMQALAEYYASQGK